MKKKHVLKTVLVVSACAYALAFAVGCTPAASSSAASGSASASSASVSAASAASSATSSVADQSGSAAASAGALTEETAVAQGYQVFKGTVHVCTAEELVKLQSVDIDPAVAGGGGTYAVLAFDQETQVTGESADGSGQRTQAAKMLGIAEHTDYSSFVVEYGDLNQCKALDGQHVVLAAKAGDIMFPSDVRLPIAEPQAKNAVILS